MTQKNSVRPRPGTKDQGEATQQEQSCERTEPGTPSAGGWLDRYAAAKRMQIGGYPRRKLVWDGLAFHANADCEAYPSQELLAAYAECSVKSVYNVLKSLEADGLISIRERRTKGERFSSNVYTLDALRRKLTVPTEPSEVQGSDGNGLPSEVRGSDGPSEVQGSDGSVGSLGATVGSSVTDERQRKKDTPPERHLRNDTDALRARGPAEEEREEGPEDSPRSNAAAGVCGAGSPGEEDPHLNGIRPSEVQGSDGAPEWPSGVPVAGSAEISRTGQVLSVLASDPGGAEWVAYGRKQDFSDDEICSIIAKNLRAGYSVADDPEVDREARRLLGIVKKAA